MLKYYIFALVITGLAVESYGEPVKSDSSQPDSSIQVSKKLPMLMDFTGFRCKNCKLMEKRLNSISGGFKGRAEIIFVDVNKEKELVKQYKITLIPTLVFVNREGKEICRKTGVMEEKAVKAKLEEVIREE